MRAEPVALCVEGIVAGYGPHTILNGISLTVASGEIVALVGHNGAGKSTLLKCIFGLLPVAAGVIQIRGAGVRKPTPSEMLSLGVAFAPQGNRVFPDLTIEEHLRLAAMSVRDKARRRRAAELAVSDFAVLNERRDQRAGTLSGGEKQMLAIAASLVTSPQIVLLDEPTLGLAQATRAEVLQRIVRLRDERRVSVLIVEQRVQEVVAIADRVLVLRRGVVAFESGADQVRRNAEALSRAYF